MNLLKLYPMTHTRYCKAEGCNKQLYGHGYCQKHYNRMRMNGSLDINPKWGKGDTPEDRFWSRVNKTDTCWLWMGSFSGNGYGQVMIRNVRWLSHRYSWFLTNGFVPTLSLLHSCDNPKCVNPAHLREGTHADNAKDKMERNRGCKGEKHGMAVLNDEDVVIIKRRLLKGECQRSIAKDFSVTPTTICHIRAGRQWKHIAQ